MTVGNAVMKYAMERAKKFAKENPSKKSKESTKLNVNVDENGVNLEVLHTGGETVYKKWFVYVHTNDRSGLPTGKWHFRDACGNRVYIKTNLRSIAQEFVNTYYGKNKYTVSASAVD